MTVACIYLLTFDKEQLQCIASPRLNHSFSPPVKVSTAPKKAIYDHFHNVSCRSRLPTHQSWEARKVSGPIPEGDTLGEIQKKRLLHGGSLSGRSFPHSDIVPEGR